LAQFHHGPHNLKGYHHAAASSGRPRPPNFPPIEGSVIQHSDYDADPDDEYFDGTSGGGDDFLNMNRVQDRQYYARLKFSAPNDPYWKDMWYLHRRDEQPDEMDHNVKEAWSLGYTGKGIVVTILDDGLERTHPDIGPNYDPDASYDVNDRDEDPTPRFESDIYNRSQNGLFL
jgi:subtilisin family serine protease